MRVLVADVDEAGLESAREALAASGAEARALRSDVSCAEDVERLAATAWEAFGGADLVFNNAGVLAGGLAWERPLADWEWVLGVNLWGVIHGLRAFLPRMLARGAPAHVVNTASVGGLLTGPMLSPYLVSKHAVVALSECVHHELELVRAPVRVSVLCPGAVATGIARSERVRPERLGRGAPAATPLARSSLAASLEAAFADGLRAGVAAGMPPAELALRTFEALREDRFWILPDPGFRGAVERRLRGILDGSNPAYQADLGPED
jgi:NAD(P)-dependent dehydrogenase (short-subunit alcohol dehydrogenase family)